MKPMTAAAALYFQPSEGASVPLNWMERGIQFLVDNGFPPREMALTSRDQSLDGLFLYPSKQEAITDLIRQGEINVLGIYANLTRGQDLVMNWQALVYVDLDDGHDFLGVPRELGYPAADLLRKALALHEGFPDPRYGVTYFHPTQKGPDFLAVGILAQSGGNYEREPQDYRDWVRKWLDELTYERRHLQGWFWDVFPASLLSDAHVNARLRSGRTLRDSGLGRLTPLKPGIWLWELSDREMIPAREALAQAGLLISV